MYCTVCNRVMHGQDNAFLGAFVRAYEKCASLIPASNTEATARMQVSYPPL